MIEASLCGDCRNIVGRGHTPELLSPVAALVPLGPETCDLCRLLKRAIAAYRDLGHRPELHGATGHLPWPILSSGIDENRGFGTRVTYTPPGVLGPQDVDFDEYYDYENSKSGAQAVFVELELTTPPSQPLPWHGFTQAAEISRYSGSEECFQRVQKWLAECLRSHQSCNKAAPIDAEAAGPTRLLDTGPLADHPTPKLIECRNGETPKYCALSYCWGEGGSGNLLTTPCSYAAHKAGMQYQKLPPLFQDAVHFTRRIGCRHIWVPLSMS